MVINYIEEIVTPYNEKYKTDHKSFGELMVDLQYTQGLNLREIEKITMVSKAAMLKEFKRSGLHNPSHFQRMKFLRPKIYALGAKKIATMTFKEIIAAFPDYTEDNLYKILKAEGFEFVRNVRWLKRRKLRRVKRKNDD